MCLTNGGEGSYAIKKQPLTQTINEPNLPEEEGNLLRCCKLPLTCTNTSMVVICN